MLLTVAESNPVQNQAAAQKLLQKMNVQNPADRRPRGRMQRGKETEDDHHIITLAEWEKKKAVTAPYSKGQNSSTVRDEDLARQLQEQFDMEDHVSQSTFGCHLCLTFMPRAAFSMDVYSYK